MAPPPGERAFVVTYTPLVATRHGREAAERFGLLPFIDGSIRREPDLGHDRPAISCLCRTDKFVPRLVVGDLVVYLTGSRKDRGEAQPHWRLTAVLKVVETFESHAAAAKWYREHALPLPANCVVEGNEAARLEQSHRLTPYSGCTHGARLRHMWDAAYRRRADRYPKMVACEPLYRELSWAAPVVHRDDLVHAFKRVPGTQNPTAFPLNELSCLMRRLGLSALPSSP